VPLDQNKTVMEVFNKDGIRRPNFLRKEKELIK
jgi:hypothetical protein